MEPVEKLKVGSDSDVRRETKQCVQTKEFVMAQLCGFPTNSDISVQEKQVGCLFFLSTLCF